MPVKKSAYKSIRKDKKKRLRNLRITSELKTLNKKVESLLGAKQLKEAREVLQSFISHMGKAAAKGIIHKNKASRKVARLTKRLIKLERGLPD